MYVIVKEIWPIVDNQLVSQVIHANKLTIIQTQIYESNRQAQNKQLQLKIIKKMNSSSIQSSDSASQDRADFERFQGIWNNIKKAKESSAPTHSDKQSNTRKSIASVKKAIVEEEQINIETRLVLTEKQLLKSKENTNLLLKKLSEAEEQIQYIEFQLQKESKEKQQLYEQYQNIQLTLTKLEKQNKSHLEKSTLRGHYSESEVEKLSQSLVQKERQVDKLMLKVKSLEMGYKNLESEISLLRENARIAQKKLQDQSFIQEQSANNYNRGSQILQLQEAYNIIERLSILLKNTQQYKTFSLPLQDTKNYHFLKNIQQRLKRNELLQKSTFTTSKVCQCMQVKVDEKLLWSPSLCYKKALELKIKYNSNLTEDCIEEMLFEMNKVYCAKEDTALKRFQQLYEKKMETLRRKSQPARYDQLVARKQIQRLKKQVLTERYSKSKSSKVQLTDNLQILKTIGQYEDELKLKQRQILLLKERITLMENQNANYDKILYLEGSLWVLDKVLAEMELNGDDLNQLETSFRQRVEGMGDDGLSQFKFLFQNLTENHNSIIDKVLLMKESTLKKMGAKKQLKSTVTTPNQHEASFGY